MYLERVSCDHVMEREITISRALKSQIIPTGLHDIRWFDPHSPTGNKMGFYIFKKWQCIFLSLKCVFFAFYWQFWVLLVPMGGTAGLDVPYYLALYFSELHFKVLTLNWLPNALTQCECITVCQRSGMSLQHMGCSGGLRHSPEFTSNASEDCVAQRWFHKNKRRRNCVSATYWDSKSYFIIWRFTRDLLRIIPVLILEDNQSLLV